MHSGAVAAATALALTGWAASAHAECSPFPQSQLIGAYSHDQVRTYVTNANGGDWTPYLVALQQNLERLQALQSNDAPVVLKVRGEAVTVSPATLNRFIFESRQFLAVARCLAEEQNLKSLAEFSTAAGGDVTAPAPAPQRMAQNADGTDATAAPVKRRDQVAGVANPLNVEIKATCSGGDTEFTIINDGPAWAGNGVVSIFRIDGPNRQMVNARRYAMQDGEIKTVKVVKSKNPTGHLGIAIEPSWYSRPFVMDAYAQCSK